MVLRLLRAAYGRLGPRYPRAVVLVLFQAAYVVVFLGISLLVLYQEMSSAQFVRLVLVAMALVALDNVLELRVVRRFLAPAQAWLDGAHVPVAAAAAWHALARLPVDYARRLALYPALFTLAPWCVYATWELGLAWWSGLILFAGGCVTVVYGVALRFLLIELAMRPVLQDVSSDLGDDFQIGPGGPPLRWKLLIVLPAITFVTGVAVAGLSTDGTASLGDLGIDVLVAVGVAFTLALEMTLLLSRSTTSGSWWSPSSPRTAAMPTSSSATACSASSGHRTGSTTTPTGRSPPRSRSWGRCGGPTGARSRSASG
jgi:hypothetical protein